MPNEQKKPWEGEELFFTKNEAKPGDPDYDLEQAHLPGNVAECRCPNCLQDKNEFADDNFIGG